MLRYKNFISDCIAKGGGKSRHVKEKIPFMHPSFFKNVILNKNNRLYGNQRLKIVPIGSNHYSTRRKHGGCCPRPFWAEIWGIHGSLVRNGTKKTQFDVYNCEFEYKDPYGTFKFEMDICWRHNKSDEDTDDVDDIDTDMVRVGTKNKTKLPWQVLNGTKDAIPRF